VVERRNIINNYLRGGLTLRVLGEVDFRVGGSVDFELFLALLCLLFSFAIFLRLDDLLKLLFAFLVF
jgi:hypothetical protein